MQTGSAHSSKDFVVLDGEISGYTFVCNVDSPESSDASEITEKIPYLCRPRDLIVSHC
jgi:hypothetical protein